MYELNGCREGVFVGDREVEALSGHVELKKPVKQLLRRTEKRTEV